ncbi:tRNA-specific adenosine deaminase subunit tad3 [Thecaphora frezii]
MVEKHLPSIPEDQHATVQSLLRYAPATPHLNPHRLTIRDAGLGSGRGVYASEPLASGTLLEVSPVLLFPPGEYERYGKFTQLDGYTFVWKRTPVGSVMALALGLGSLFNHSTTPNVNYHLDHATQSIRYTLLKSVQEGEELCISYGVGRMWWEEKEQEDQPELADEQKEYRRMAGVGVEGFISSDEESHEEDNEEAKEAQGDKAQTILAAQDAPASHQPSNGIELHAQAGPSRAASPRDLPPLYRMTSAQDPRTLPLETTPAWIVDIAPRNSSAAVKYLQKHSQLLQSRDDGRFPTRHLRSFKTEKRKTPEGKEETLIRFLVCLRDAMPERRDVVQLLQDASDAAFAPPSVFSAAGAEGQEQEQGQVQTEAMQPQPYLADVPATAAPTKERLAEWTKLWPCIVRSGIFSPNAGGPFLTAQPGTTSVGVVDRRSEEAMWTEDAARLRWAMNRFRRVVAMAKRAKQEGQVGVAIHITHPYEASVAWAGFKERERLDWACIDTADAASPAPQVGREAAASEATEAAASWRSRVIEVDATDERIRLRNPLKHAVVQGVAKVAELRALDRQQPPPAAASPAQAAASSNGQDYLLTGLVLFTTHEPCVYCSMALVHSRVKAVYFLLPSPGRGGCCGAQLPGSAKCDAGDDGGVYAIQEQRGLNHAFQVWRWFRPELFQGDEPGERTRSGAWTLEKIKVELELGRLDP